MTFDSNENIKIKQQQQQKKKNKKKKKTENSRSVKLLFRPVRLQLGLVRQYLSGNSKLQIYGLVCVEVLFFICETLQQTAYTNALMKNFKGRNEELNSEQKITKRD